LNNKWRLCNLSVGRNCTDLGDVETSDGGLIPNLIQDVDLDAESDRCDILLSQLQHDWPNELRSNILFYMAGWVALKVSN
jgi:hypothetical protein